MKFLTVCSKNRLASMLLAATALLSSCGPAKDIVYLQDLPDNAVLRLQENGELRLQPGDRVIVRVHSRDEELAKMFNIDQVRATEATFPAPIPWTRTAKSTCRYSVRCQSRV